MLGSRIMHIPAHQAYCLTNVWSGVKEVEQSTNQSLVPFFVHRISTLSTQFVILLDRCGCHIASHHPCFIDEVQHILPLAEYYPLWPLGNLNAEEVLQLSQVLYFEYLPKKIFQHLDIIRVISSYDN